MKINNGVLKGRIPKRLIELSYEFSNRKDARNNLLKTYSIILHKQEQEIRRNKKRNNPKPQHQLFISISSSYFTMVISKRYYTYKKFLIDNGMIRVKGRELDNYESKTNLFGDTKRVETYKVNEFSKSYLIVDYPKDNDIEYSFKLKFKTNPLIQKNQNFLFSIGIKNPKITRDNYGFRLYHNLSTTYKKVLPQKGSFIFYDFKTSIPFQLKKLIKGKLKSLEIYDDPFLELFEGDFYDNWNVSLALKIEERSSIKKQFSTIIYGGLKDYSPKTRNLIKDKFPLFYNLINKDLGRKLTRMETKMVLYDIVSKLDTDRILTIHDAIIIHQDDEVNLDKQLSHMKFHEEGFVLVKGIISQLD